MDKTKQILSEMLKENTGRGLLDSGGAYGRNWERNQDVDFDKQPESWAEWNCWKGEAEVQVTASAYHYLRKRLSYCPELQANFEAWVSEYDNAENIAWLQLAEAYADYLSDGTDYNTVNSYNFDNPLSQTIQYVEFEWGGDRVVLLQIHGGCDVRGGYTAPKAFKIEDTDRFYGGMELNGPTVWGGGAHWNYDGSVCTDTSSTLIDDVLAIPAIKEGEEIPWPEDNNEVLCWVEISEDKRGATLNKGSRSIGVDETFKLDAYYDLDW